MSKTEFMKTVSDAVDPYQAFFDYLIEDGMAPAAAWDAVWEGCPSSLSDIYPQRELMCA